MSLVLQAPLQRSIHLSRPSVLREVDDLDQSAVAETISAKDGTAVQTPASILWLQRLAGNSAVAQLLTQRSTTNAAHESGPSFPFHVQRVGDDQLDGGEPEADVTVAGTAERFNPFGGLPWANESNAGDSETAGDRASGARDLAPSPDAGLAAVPVGQNSKSLPTAPPAQVNYGVNLCFTPLEAFTEKGMKHDKAYRLATHVFVEFDGTSAGFTRAPGESIVEAQVHSPDESSKNPEKRCTPAYAISTNPSKAPTREEAIKKLHAAARAGDLKAEYSVTSNNCETYARWLLNQAGLTAGPAPGGGGLGNRVLDYWQAFGSPWLVRDAGWVHRKLTSGNWGI